MNQLPQHAAFSHLLLMGTFVHEYTYEQMQEAYGVTINPTLVMLVSVDRYPDLIIGKEIEWKIELGQTLMKAICKMVTAPFTWLWIEEGVVALLIELPVQTEQTPLSLNAIRIANEIQKASDAERISVSIGIGTYYSDPVMLQRSYQEAMHSMIDRFFQGNRMIFSYMKKKQSEAAARETMSAYKENIERERVDLLARVHIGDVEGAITVLPTLLEKVAQANQYNVSRFQSEVVNLVMMVSRLVLEAGFSAETILTENAHFIQELYRTIRYDKFVQKVCTYVRQLTEQIALTQTLYVSPLIRQAVRFIKEQLNERIMLEEVAQYCCLSKYHLSHLFKREVGLSVIDFINKLRLEKAKYYLETTDLTVQQIASQVGFQDASYFSRMFKKVHQFSPSEYRSRNIALDPNKLRST
ncbi:helix-turn-helix domain-containing protein [Aneurinibacillus uraniidurans]|uniref:helix-turn-helix domain-containing protein n=1 Tax=Aneurinibacillus uraniidurans TaxID=2966586 RepID=UPI002348F559|nr:helix-turn-helix domain-containing protein [Aneurinibacillus sp. B1]WCN37633.1 helix-turn-helix domain-containing protein [Aneurinibacillus sp. B1]